MLETITPETETLEVTTQEVVTLETATRETITQEISTSDDIMLVVLIQKKKKLCYSISRQI